MHAISNKPDDQAEWRNILQLMFHLRKALACSSCGSLVSTCREIHGDGFEVDTNLRHTLVGFSQMCKYIVAKDMVHKWSNLRVSTEDESITFGQLIQEGYNSESSVNGQNLGHKFIRRVKEKEHHCRCGGKASGNLTCLGQRCACYRKGKACVNCKCSGCKNPNGTPSNGFQNTDPT